MASLPLPIDPALLDPFLHNGFIGILDRSAERAQEVAILKKAGLDLGALTMVSPDVAYYRFDNGFAAGVLLGTKQRPACSVGNADKPFEMAVLHGRKLKVCYASSVTSGVICPLDAVNVGRMLDEIAGLSAKPGCRHHRPRET